ncbi:MAG: sigma-70 region 4 domain-containing protein, partial [Bacteroidales bacterium]|nr:sigma-70 region 4 domain-containing protein [Bacteroidales bacterium]
LSLRLVEEYDYPDIAQLTGTSQSNIRSQYSRAKQRLLELLRQDGVKCVNNCK